MAKIKVAINGFGRIGRVCMRAMLKKENIDVVAINDLADTTTLAQLFKYDSIQGQFEGSVEPGEKHITINEQVIYAYSSRDPKDLPWADLGVDIVIESTGLFRSEEDASKHLEAGAKKVIISAPGKGDVKTVVLGINDNTLDGTEKVISNASCTTNCCAPLVKIVDELWNIENGFITTTHSYTSDQRLHDAPHSDMRRARAAAVNIVPTTTGAANAVIKIFPQLEGKLHGSALRVPVITGSLTELTCCVKNQTTAEEVNAAFKNIANTELKGILEYTELPLVSCDIIGNPHSSILDAGLTVVQGKMIKVVAWYDNEAGYSHRLADLVERIA